MVTFERTPALTASAVDRFAVAARRRKDKGTECK
jgi:hypothetical protein